MQQLEFHPAIPPPSSPLWKEVEPGIFEHTLNTSPSPPSPSQPTSPSSPAAQPPPQRRTLLQRWLPHISNVCQDFVHAYIEEIFIVEGQLMGEDDEARGVQGGTWTRGAYAYRKPGMRHGPFRSGGEGCLMFITCTPVGSGEEEEGWTRE